MKTRKISIKRIFLSLAYATLNNLWSEWRTIGSTSGEVRHSIVILTRSYPLTYWPCLLIEEEVATLKRKISRVFRFLSILSSILKGFFSEWTALAFLYEQTSVKRDWTWWNAHERGNNRHYWLTGRAWRTARCGLSFINCGWRKINCLTFRLKSAIYCQLRAKWLFEKALMICPSRRQDKIKSRTHPPYGALCPG